MRGVHFTSLVMVSLMLMGLTLLPGLARAADDQPLDASEQAFLMRAMTDNNAQIAMAKLALQKSTNPQVISLANSVIQERTALDARLTQLMARGNERADSNQPVAGNDLAMSKLQSVNGDAFDRTFASMVVRNHCRLISAYEVMKVASADLALRELAHETIPALRGNLTVAMALLRGNSWTPSHSQAMLSAASPHAAKNPGVKNAMMWEPISFVAAPW